MPRRRSANNAGSATTPKRLRRSERIARRRVNRDAALGGTENVGRRRFVADGEFNQNNLVLNPIEEDNSKGTVLVATSIDFHITANREGHHTSEYDLEELVIRRGQEFVVTLNFERVFDPETDSIVLQLTYGDRPQESKGTIIRLPVKQDATLTNDDWSAVIESRDKDSSVKVKVISAADAIIGRYRVFAETVSGTDKIVSRKEFEETFVLLFNAWCKEDEVYMEDDKERTEYVLNERGRIWQGTARNHSPLAWNFGQFEDVCTEASLYLLDKAELADGARSNPLIVIRCLSAMSNSNDEDGGVLTGRWSDTYPKSSTVPWAWMGSVAILEEFMQRKRAVKFGQCWVFSGLLTTLLRTLGIPSRSVTNFESAHDTDASMTIDFHWKDEDDSALEEYNDSVWNFHVWNEAWCARPDLPSGYAGWQAVDATPQELSEGVMRCGPAPVKAIREGSVYMPHDAPFIFSEVNGDKVHWTVKEDGSMKVLGKETNVIGVNISTKAVGSNHRNDITHEYKHAEGSAEEREAVHKAFRYSSRRKHQVYDVPPPDVTFTLDAPDEVTVGDDFTVFIELKNTTEEQRTVSVRLSAVCSYYTGVTSERVATNHYTESLGPGENKKFDLPISHEAYQKFLKPDSMVTIYLKGNVKETKKSYAKIDTIRMLKPKLTIKVPEQVSIGERFEVKVSFENPLPDPLTNGVLHVEARGMGKSLVIPLKTRIVAGSEMSHSFSLVAQRSGEKEILVNFSCDQLSGVSGEADVKVAYSD
ncbi:hypothetical protein CAPTEDRAFT_156823 [Capitella teleta]|uniref:Transglutaminase-like domain-containing protein n=1 Tax=Capitella teleta TaxID=283909 RepID=R7TH83_CAPTE|nr:hypothetical protein CAPTEDRAFT_156823 [Capitella teleta]|eukprot:ELT93168.1 hypothetical protein CAPTEDRAFT_156823 [Capitella teleta]